MSKDQYKHVKEDVEKPKKAGIPVVFIDYYEPFNVTTHTKSTLILGKLLGKGGEEGLHYPSRLVSWPHLRIRLFAVHSEVVAS